MRTGKKISSFFVIMIMILSGFEISTIAEVSYVSSDILNFVDELATIENERFGEWSDANIIKSYEMSSNIDEEISVL
ncbi:MAG: hypothetical protein IJC76_04840 [Lachnospiraceae bacterium]|nr:hypothetical protein [Lachnospiraceae bacterium]